MEVGSSSLPGTTSEFLLRDTEAVYIFYMSEDDSYDTDRGYGGLAQLARAPALQAGGQRFESVILHVSENFRIGDARSQSLKILH